MPVAETPLERHVREHGPGIDLGNGHMLLADGSRLVNGHGIAAYLKPPPAGERRDLPDRMRWHRLRLQDLEAEILKWRTAGYQRYSYSWNAAVLGPLPYVDYGEAYLDKDKDPALHKAQGARLFVLRDDVAAQLNYLQRLWDPINAHLGK